MLLFFQKKKAFLPLLAFIVGLRAEARLLRPLDARVFIGGGSPAGARDAAAHALAAGATALISFGLAGGLSTALKAGDLVVPRAVLSHGRHILTDQALSEALGGWNADSMLAGDATVGSVGGKAERRAGTGADAVDLESGAVAAAAQAANIPVGVLRAVCDPADRALPPAALAALTAGGGIGLLRVATSVMLNPGQIGALAALSADAAAARRALIARVAMLRAEGRLAIWG